MSKSLPKSKLTVSDAPFGIYNPGTMGISLSNMDEIDKAVTKDRERIEQWFAETNNAHIPESLRLKGFTEARAVHLTEDEAQKFQRMKEEHQRRFDDYYRIRVHEKNHWYLHISSVVPIARFFAGEDSNFFLWSEIKNVASSTTQPILLPLIRWAQMGDCPPKLVRVITLYNWIRIIDAAVDGDLLPQHFIKGKHALSFYFPDLSSQGEFWRKPHYRIGYKALIEGAGKAAEWLYDLRKDPSISYRAWREIKRSPPIYRLALECLMQALGDKSLLEYLQLLSVVVEFAINPYISDKSWPFLWGEAKAMDILPGFRFQRLLDLLKKNPRVDARSKMPISHYLCSASAEEYGWPSPIEACKQLLSSLKKAYTRFDGLNGVNLMEEKLWDPLETIRTALRVKLTNELAYVAPVNADIINYSGTYAPVMLTSLGSYAADVGALATHLLMWWPKALLNTIVYCDAPFCPITQNEWFAHCFSKSTDACRFIRACGTPMDTRSKLEIFHQCGIYNGLMVEHFGDWLDRIKFLEAN